MEEAIQEMRNQIAGMQQQLQALTTENASLRQSQQATAQGGEVQTKLLETMGQLLEEARGRSSILIDTKGLARPTTFANEDAKFLGWSRKVENFLVGSFGEDFRRVLEWAVEEQQNIGEETVLSEFGPEALEEDVVPEVKRKMNQLYTVLVSLTEDESNDIVIGSGAGNGLEAWRRLHRRWDPSTGGRKRALLKSIISPPRCRLEKLQGCLERWQEQVRKYEKMRNHEGFREKVTDDVKQAALEMLVPTDIENHLVLNNQNVASRRS